MQIRSGLVRFRLITFLKIEYIFEVWDVPTSTFGEKMTFVVTSLEIIILSRNVLLTDVNLAEKLTEIIRYNYFELTAPSHDKFAMIASTTLPRVDKFLMIL